VTAMPNPFARLRRRPAGAIPTPEAPSAPGPGASSSAPGPGALIGQPLSATVRAPRRLGWTTVILVFVVGGVLSVAAPLAGAALAPGVVSPDGSRKTVQHLEGGIVRQIHVREGDAVRPGQPLLTLDDTRARAEFEELREGLTHLVALEARLLAERQELTVVQITDRDGILDPDALAAAVADQQALLASRRETLAGRERILAQRILQLEEENGGLREVIEAQAEEIRLIEREIAAVQTMVDKGLERMPRLLALQRARASLQGERAGNRARIARNDQAIGETRVELLTLQQQEREKVDEQLGAVRAELATQRSLLPARLDALRRTVLVAPMAGTVMNVRVTTESGVIGSGEPILDLVPSGSSLVVDARVRPIDVDVVRPGMSAKVVLSAFAQRNLPEIQGTLRSISADALTDERTGERFFLAKVEVDPADLASLSGGLELMPGMPAEVFILTGERTAFDYLIRPFFDSMNRSFRES